MGQGLYKFFIISVKEMAANIGVIEERWQENRRIRANRKCHAHKNLQEVVRPRVQLFPSTSFERILVENP